MADPLWPALKKIESLFHYNGTKGAIEMKVEASIVNEENWSPHVIQLRWGREYRCNLCTYPILNSEKCCEIRAAIPKYKESLWCWGKILPQELLNCTSSSVLIVPYKTNSTLLSSTAPRPVRTRRDRSCYFPHVITNFQHVLAVDLFKYVIRAIGLVT